MKPFCYHSFDLRQLVSFAEIARAGSFRQAAKTLHIAQPALSRQIKQLEAALGICLFDRAPRRLQPHDGVLKSWITIGSAITI
jgi:LysR family transcriptional regulator, nitrogen assimilation regulatory protein